MLKMLKFSIQIKNVENLKLKLKILSICIKDILVLSKFTCSYYYTD